MILLKSSQRHVRPEWTSAFNNIPQVSKSYLKLSREQIKWNNHNSLPAACGVVWRWFLDSDGSNHHGSQSWTSGFLVVASKVVPLVLIKAVVAVIELIVEKLIIGSWEIVFSVLLLYSHLKESYMLHVDGGKKGQKQRSSMSWEAHSQNSRDGRAWNIICPTIFIFKMRKVCWQSLKSEGRPATGRSQGEKEGSLSLQV